jgi:hypothetical protein
VLAARSGLLSVAASAVARTGVVSRRRTPSKLKRADQRFDSDSFVN